MDDLTKCLYDFLQERRMGRLREDEECKVCSLAVELQEKRVESFLNEAQREELDRLIDSIMARNCVESEYLFRAALKLIRECSALVRG